MSEAGSFHIEMGEPLGEFPDSVRLAEWLVGLVKENTATLTGDEMLWLRTIGEFLHVESTDEGARKEALECYFNLFDSVTGTHE